MSCEWEKALIKSEDRPPRRTWFSSCNSGKTREEDDRFVESQGASTDRYVSEVTRKMVSNLFSQENVREGFTVVGFTGHSPLLKSSPDESLNLQNHKAWSDVLRHGVRWGQAGSDVIESNLASCTASIILSDAWIRGDVGWQLRSNWNPMTRSEGSITPRTSTCCKPD